MPGKHVGAGQSGLFEQCRTLDNATCSRLGTDRQLDARPQRVDQTLTVDVPVGAERK